MFLVNQGSTTSGLDKENVGTPARSKIMTAQNTPVLGLKLATAPNTPGMLCTPARRPLAQVNQDMQRSTPRMLSKPLMTPRLQGTPKAGSSKTLGKRSSRNVSSRKPGAARTEAQQHQWKDNLHSLADDMVDKIIKEEMGIVCKEFKMKLEQTSQPGGGNTGANNREASQSLAEITSSSPINSSTDVTEQQSNCCTPILSAEVSLQLHADVSNVLADICSRIADMELSQQQQHASIDEGSSIDLVSLLGPLKDWNFRSVVSLLTPVKSNRLLDGERVMKQQVVDTSCTGTVMTPVRYRDMPSGMTPGMQIETSSGMTPVRHAETSARMTPLRQADMASEMTPVKHVETFSEMTPVRHIDTFSEMTPIVHKEASSGTPVRVIDVSVCQTPITTADNGTCVTPTHHANAFTETYRTDLKDSAVTGTTIDFKDLGTGMTPVKHTDTASSCMTPIKMVHSCSETTAAELTDTGSDPIPTDTSSLSTMTSPVKVSHVEVSTEATTMIDEEVGTSPVKVVDSGCGMTPVRSMDSGCGITPAKMIDTATSITPVTHSEAEMTTSPMVVPLFRWEAAKEQNLDSGSLLDHLETASISNQLLRREVQMWTEKHATVTEQLNKAKENLQKKGDVWKREQAEVSKLDSLAKATLENDLEDLMNQIGEQMMQIGELQNAVSKKSNEIEAVHREKLDCQEQYQKEIHNLQEDLKTAYRQHQQQISELEDEIRTNDYKEHYQRSQDTIKFLQMELEAYSGLDDTMQKAAKIEEEFGCLEETLANVTTLFHKTMEQKAKWHAENQAFKLESVAQLSNVKEMQIQLHHVEQQCQGLISTNFELENNLKISQECRSVLLADLGSSRSTVDDQQAQLDCQATELEDLRVQQRQLKEKIQSLEDNTEFIEEERRALLEASKDADDNLRVASMELSRCKVALEESEDARKQWQSAVEDLSERLQESQSELDNTKAYAHYMLLNQASEMRDAAQGLEDIQQEMNATMQQLKDTMGLDLMKEEELSPIKNFSSPSLNSSSSLSGASSIVASVLSALKIKGSSTPKENSSSLSTSATGEEMFNQNLSDYEQRDMAMADSIRESMGGPRIVIGQSAGSAFTSLDKSSNSNASTKTPVKETDSVTSLDGKDRNSGPVLVDQVGQMRLLFGHVLKGLVVHANTLQASLQDIKDERDSIQKNSTKSRQNFHSELSLVQEQLRVSENQERALQQELANSKARVGDLEQSLQYAEQRVHGMADNLARFSDQKYVIEKLRHDFDELRAAHKVSETEKTALQQVLDDLVTRVNSNDTGHKGSEVYGAVIKDNCKLKMENEKLRIKMLERQQQYEGLNTRANRQMKVLENNWKKAEAEIYSLDEVFDKCKQLIQGLPASEDEHTSLKSLRDVFQ